jgi:N-acetylmuramoyl-L-alanine amidase
MMTWLADVLRGAGLPVREVPGWRTRGHGDMGKILGVLAHHTAGPSRGDYPSESVVVNGRTGLPGPLCNLGLARSGEWVVVAAGQAWHAGTGSVPWCPANQGNTHLIGVEAESTGTHDDWTPAQRANYPRGVAALLAHFGLPASRAIGHKEWAPSRKIDPAFWDMNRFRADVARWMGAPATAPLEDDVSWTDPLPDYYTANPGDRLPAGETLAWGTAHAANARDAARQAVTQVSGLSAKVDALAARLASGPTAGPAQLTDADVARIAQAVVSLLGKKASS